MPAAFEPLRGDAMRDHPRDELLTSLIAVVATEPTSHDDLQIWEARAWQSGPFRNAIENIGGIQVDHERAPGALGRSVNAHRTVYVLARPGNEGTALRPLEQLGEIILDFVLG